MMSMDQSTGATSPEGFIELEAHIGHTLCSITEARPVTPADIVSFWQEAGKALWFGKDADFDRLFHDRFSCAYEAARRGALQDWLATPNGALALLILLDQFPRNAFRGTPRMYESDAQALDIAGRAVAAGFDLEVDTELRVFIYTPFHHSEALADQDRAVELCRPLSKDDVRAAQRHRDIIKRFGRFPHRNVILGRTMTDEEQRFLDQGGYAG